MREQPRAFTRSPMSVANRRSAATTSAARPTSRRVVDVPPRTVAFHAAPAGESAGAAVARAPGPPRPAKPNRLAAVDRALDTLGTDHGDWTVAPYAADEKEAGDVLRRPPMPREGGAQIGPRDYWARYWSCWARNSVHSSSLSIRPLSRIAASSRKYFSRGAPGANKISIEEGSSLSARNPCTPPIGT